MGEDVRGEQREGIPAPSLATVTSLEESTALSVYNRELFVQTYLETGCNATKAYLAIHPNCSESSANSCGYRMLNSAQIKDALARAIDARFNRDTVRALIDERMRLTRTSKIKRIAGLTPKGPTDVMTVEEVIIDNTAALALAANVLGMTKDQSSQGVSVTFNVAGLDQPVDVTVGAGTDTGTTKQGNP